MQNNPNIQNIADRIYYELDKRFVIELLDYYKRSNGLVLCSLELFYNYSIASGILYRYNKLIENIIPVLVVGLNLHEEEIDVKLIEDLVKIIEKRYPVYSTQKNIIIKNSVSQLIDIFTKLNHDKLLLEKHFCVSTSFPIDIKVGQGDYHRGGQSVSFIKYPSATVVFKPRDLSIDQLFNRLLDWLYQALQLDTFSPIIINRGNYGWQEYVSNKECHCETEVQEYYYRIGIIIALLYCLEGTDIHYENIIACGRFPIIIDLESIMCPNIPIDGTETNQGICENVLKNGLLYTVFDTNRTTSVDIGGLSDVSRVFSPFLVGGYEYGDSGQIRFTPKKSTIKAGNNIPRLHGCIIPAEKYVDSICSGFQDSYNYILNNRQLLIDEISKIQDETAIRVIFRDTVAYAAILHETNKIELLKKEEDYIKFITSSLNRDVVDCLVLGRVIKHEIEDICHLDIPYFYTKVGSKHLWTTSNVCLTNFFEYTGKESVLKKIRSLSREDMEQQCWIIGSSLRINDYIEKSRIKIESEINASTRNRINTNEHRLITLINDTYQYILENVCITDSAVTWLNHIPKSLDSSVYSLYEASYDLFYGMPGVILFLYSFGILFNNSEAIQIAEKAYTHLHKRITSQQKSIKPVGLYAGWGSIVFLNTKLFEITKDRLFLQSNKELLESINLPDLIRRDHNYSVIKGSAGLILSLCDYYNKSHDPYALSLSELAADHLLINVSNVDVGVGWRIASKMPLSGYGHGASGFALALFRLMGIHPMRRPLFNIVKNILKYENSLFDENQRNWLDKRDYIVNKYGDDYCSTAWSHGAGGIGLVRLELIKSGLFQIDNISMVNDANIAIETVYRNGISPNLELSYGSFGNLELCLNYSLFKTDDSLYNNRLQEALHLLLTLYQTGNYRLGTSHKTLNFMTGFCGVGYQSMRLLSPNKVPSVLIL